MGRYIFKSRHWCNPSVSWGPEYHQKWTPACMRVTVLLMGSILMLSACDMTSESRISVSPITVQEHRVDRMVPVGAVSIDMARGLADHYAQYGQGPVSVLVLYLAGTPEQSAQQEANRIASILKEAGIGFVNTETLPVNDATKSSQARISYTALSAQAPKDCPVHPADSRAEMQKSQDGLFPDYRFGCGVDTYIAGQVARPSDLLGKDNIDDAAGERGSAQLRDYREGKAFKDLKGTNASELKTQ